MFDQTTKDYVVQQMKKAGINLHFSFSGKPMAIGSMAQQDYANLLIDHFHITKSDWMRAEKTEENIINTKPILRKVNPQMAVEK